MSLAEVLGQPRAIRMLQKAVSADRMSHAWLFAGPPASGKRLAARNFAKLINCQSPQESEGVVDCCDKCTSCTKIDSFNHPDVKWIEPEGKISTIKIEAIRGLQSSIYLKNYEAKWKAYVILEADSMTEQAANALLKTLEEPPAGATLILTAGSVNRLLPTIVSRCQIVKFNALKLDQKVKILTSKLNLDSEQAVYLSRLSESVNTDALEEEEDFLRYKNDLIDEFISGFSNTQTDSGIYRMQKRELEFALAAVLWWYRDILVYKKTADLNLIANIDRSEDIKKESQRFGEGELAVIINSIVEAQALLKRNVNPKLVLSKIKVPGTFSRKGTCRR